MTIYGSFVVPVTLASPSDFTTWNLGVAGPSNIVAILRSCTSIVLDAAEGVIYDVDPLTGLATDTQVKTALMETTCIQAVAWVALGIDPALGGVTTQTVKASKKILSAAITYDTGDTAAAAAARARALTELVPDAWRKLQQNNLLGTTAYGRG